MRQRCRNPRNIGYKRYGGRGISICEHWNDFATFLADMGPRPSPEHSIDRIDGDGNYEPSNCRWATPKKQRRNISTSKLTEKQVAELRTYAENGGNLAEWARRNGVTRQAARAVVTGKTWAAEASA